MIKWPKNNLVRLQSRQSDNRWRLSLIRNDIKRCGRDLVITIFSTMARDKTSIKALYIYIRKHCVRSHISGHIPVVSTKVPQDFPKQSPTMKVFTAVFLATVVGYITNDVNVSKFLNSRFFLVPPNTSKITYHQWRPLVHHHNAKLLTFQGAPNLKSFKWNSCGAEDDPIRMESWSISPDPILIPGTVTIAETLVADVDIVSPTKVTSECFYNKTLTLFSHQYL